MANNISEENEKNVQIVRQNIQCNGSEAGEYYIGVPWNFCFKIYDGNQKIGIVFLSELRDDELYIEWIRFNKNFQGKGYLRSVIQRLEETFPTKSLIRAVTSEENLDKYLHVGFEQGEFDQLLEMYEIRKKIR